MKPADGRRMPAISKASVDLPLPESPSSNNESPAWIVIDLTLNNAMVSAKKRGSSDCKMDHRSFAGDLRIPSITRMMLSMSSSMSLGQPLASSFFDKDQTPSSGLSSGL